MAILVEFERIKFAAAFAAALAACVMPACAAQASGTAVESFVQQNVDAGVKILQDKSVPVSTRHERFRDFLLQLMDLKRVALYTLGPWRRNASQADLDTFVEAFRNFALANYESRINSYGGETLKVVGSSAHADNDYVVTTHLVDSSDPNSSDPPLEVDLRVLSENGKFVVVDASVEGIWLALTQREELTSFLDQHNGDFKALDARLDQLSAQLLETGPSTAKN